MALTPAKKMRRREKLKTEGCYKEYKDKVREAVKKSREKKSKALTQLPKHVQETFKKEERKKCKARVMKCRALKSEKLATQSSSPNVDSPAFKSAKSLGKAVAKLKKVLPKSPRKKISAVKKLFEVTIPNNCKEDTRVLSSPGSSILPPATAELVKKFYERDDISRQAPGMKDVVTVRHKDGSKTREQARHLLSSVSESYALFKHDHNDIKIGKSKFHELRPKHILLRSKIPFNVCLCKYHENFIMSVNSFHKMNNQFPEYSNSFPETMLCILPKEECWLSRCHLCKNSISKKLQECLDEDALSAVSWFVWQDDQGRQQKVVKEDTMQDLADHIISLAMKFLEHTYVKREQAKAYKLQRDIVSLTNHPPNLCLMQIDFSENYTCIYQDEIQSAHWHQSQVSLLTAAIWHTGTHHPVVIASDNLTHSKETVVAYLDILFESLPTAVDDVHVWSDGPFSQFKNRFIVNSISELEKKHQKKITWNYFATSHGKGPVDGIGGAVKRLIREAVKSRKQIVTCASEFVKVSNMMTKVYTLEATTTDINQRNKKLHLDEIVDKAEQIPGISRMHAFRISNGKAKTFFLSKKLQSTFETPNTCSENGDIPPQQLATADPDLEIKVDDWYLVNYEGKEYPGIVTEKTEDQYKVNVMEHVGSKSWKWPVRRDEIWYTRGHLLRKITPPFVVNRREHFQFHND